jgi:hypothetical protein
VIASYRGLIDTLVIDGSDEADTGEIEGVTVVALDTHIAGPTEAMRLAEAILRL